MVYSKKQKNGGGGGAKPRSPKVPAPAVVIGASKSSAVVVPQGAVHKHDEK